MTEDETKLLAYYDAEFARRFARFRHPYTQKPITSVQDYLDAMESMQTHRSIITERALSLAELQAIFAEKFKNYKNLRTGNNIRDIGDYLEAIDEQTRIDKINAAKKEQQEIEARNDVAERTHMLAKDAEEKEKRKIEELKKQEKEFFRKQRIEKIENVLLTMFGLVCGLVVWFLSAVAVSWFYEVMKGFPVISSILYWPGGVGAIETATINTMPYAWGGMTANAIGGKMPRKIFAWIFIAWNILAILIPLFASSLGFSALFSGLLGIASCALLLEEK